MMRAMVQSSTATVWDQDRGSRVPGPVHPRALPSQARSREQLSRTPDLELEVQDTTAGLALGRRIALKIKHLYN